MNATFLGVQLNHGQGDEVSYKETAQGNKPLPKKSIFTAQELLSTGITEIPMFWKPFFPAKGVVGLTGTSDCGKSMFLRQLALSASQGNSHFLDFPLFLKHSKALYVCTEDDDDGITALLGKQAIGAEENRLSNLFFLFGQERIFEKVDEFLNETKVDIVVIDVWSDTFMENPNSWVDVRKNLTKIQGIAEKHECLITILHHTVKNSEKHVPDKAKLNGSQAIEAKLRCLLELRNGEADDERALYVLKANYMSRREKSDGLILKLDENALQFSNSGRSISKIGLVKEDGKKRYDANFWINQMLILKKEQKLSYDKAMKVLQDSFPDDKVPCKTWFVEQFKNLDSQLSAEEVE